LTALQASKNFAVAYIYCDYDSQAAQTPENLIGSLLKQVLQQCPEPPQSLRESFRAAGPDKMPLLLAEQIELLLKIAEQFDGTYIVIDALDESDNARHKHRKPILDALSKIMASSLHIFVTSRPYPPDIERIFRNCPRLDIAANEADVRRRVGKPSIANESNECSYLSMKLDTDEDLEDLIGDDEEYKGYVIAAIMGKAGNQYVAFVLWNSSFIFLGRFLLMSRRFLLPALHIDELSGSTCRATLEETLNDMSSGLESTYNRALERIKSTHRKEKTSLALAILMWISFSKRPITIQELQQALMIQTNTTKLDTKYRRTSKVIIDVCLGLIQVEKESHIVRLVHFTFQEYLQKRPEIFEDVSPQIAPACLIYLGLKDFESGPARNDALWNARVAQYPFLQYAATYWNQHLREDPKSEKCTHQALEFLLSSSKVAACAQILEVRTNHGPVHSQGFSHGADGLWLAARCGMSGLVRYFIEKGFDVNRHTSLRGTPLHQASQNGHTETVRILLEAGAQLDIIPGLLSRRLCVENTNPQPQSFPLIQAAHEGSEELAIQLLNEGANANSQDSEGRSVLHIAISKHMTDVAMELLKRGANTNAIDTNTNRPRTPLLESIQNFRGSVAVIEALLQHGADPNICDHDSFKNRTALHMAALHGTFNLVLLLLEHGASESCLDSDGKDALLLAYSRGDAEGENIADLLGGVILYASNQAVTALVLAIEYNHASTVQFLLDSGANIHLTNERGYSPIHAAASLPSADILSMLLRQEINLNMQSCQEDLHGNGSTTSFCHPLQLKALIDMEDIWGRTPIRYAINFGGTESIRTLLDLGARPTRLKGGPLNWEIPWENSEMIRLYLREEP
jgi:ankyrin repeat protein